MTLSPIETLKFHVKFTSACKLDKRTNVCHRSICSSQLFWNSICTIGCLSTWFIVSLCQFVKILKIALQSECLDGLSLNLPCRSEDLMMSLQLLYSISARTQTEFNFHNSLDYYIITRKLIWRGIKVWRSTFATAKLKIHHYFILA